MNGRREDRILYLPTADPEQPLRLHLDENVSGATARLLRQRGFDVTTAADVGLRAQPDVRHISFAVEQQRVIITRDRDFLQLHEEEHAHSGIVYWPHDENASLGDMQEALVDVLMRVSQSPTTAAELAAVSRRRRRKGHGRQSKPPFPHAKRLPAGLLVQGTVRQRLDTELEIQLATGQWATIAPHRLPTEPPVTGARISAVTVEYVQSQKRLHLSMRRNFSLARSLPTWGVKQVRRHDQEWVRSLQEKWPIEIVLEGENTLRVYGQTSAAVRSASQDLQRHIPWTASAILNVNRTALREWMRSAFGGGVGRLSHATDTLVRHHGQRSLTISARSNRELDEMLRRVAAHVPDSELVSFQAAREEPLMPCQWQAYP